MKTRVLSDFEIVHMNRNSLTLKDKRDGTFVNITRKLFNNLDNVEEIRVVDRDYNGCMSKWIEGRYWSRF